MSVSEIIIAPVEQTFRATLGAKTYNMRLLWCDSQEGGWTLDIADNDDTPLVYGIPLVTGADLLSQYFYLNFGGYLYCVTDGDWRKTPTHDNLGKTAHLLWEPYVT